MNSLRNAIGFLVALMFAAFAMPSLAATGKIYSVNVSPLGPNPVAVTIKNETPNGNSTINSFSIQPPSGVTVTLASPASSASATVTMSGGNVQVNNFNGLKSGNQTPKTITIYLNATYNGGSGPTCNTGYTWTASVFTGNSLGGDTFDPVVGTTPPTNATQQSAPCNYSLSMMGSVPAGAANTLTATLTNAAASAGSFNSVTLTAPAGFTIASAMLSGKTGTVSALPAGSVTITNISPAVAPGGSLGLSLQVSTACGASTGTWGSSVAGGFTLTGSNPSTAVTGACRLTFTTPPPSSIVNGIAFIVGVGAVDGSGAPISSFTGPVTLTLNTLSGSGTLNAGTGTASNGVVTFSNATITGTGGTFTLTAASTLGTASVSTTTSTITLYLGQLDCQDPAPLAANVPAAHFSADKVMGVRWFNKDGSKCVLVDYSFTDLIVTNSDNTLHQVWDTNLQPNAVFTYAVSWNPVWADPVTGLPTPTQVAWNLVGLPQYVDARYCLTPTLPGSLGTLPSGPDITNSQTTITVNGPATTTFTSPFPIVIDQERMNVTGISGSGGTIWTVARGQGGTPAVSHVTTYPDFTAKKVMSTPLPLDGNGVTGNQMHMCIFNQNVITKTPNNCPSPPPAGPPACLQVDQTILDEGDGWASQE